MPYCVRMMYKEDVAQVSEIDREAFPTQWPSANYEHELRNRLARHMVACDVAKPVEPPRVQTQPESTRLTTAIRRLFNRNRSSSDETPLSNRHYITGFVGLWVMADETHVTAIAVREAYRRQGIGELLLIATIDLAAELKTRTVTLEVRASNTSAQSLYIKYGFNQVGVRRGYYLDNKEDGIVMTTIDITSAAFRKHLEELKQAHSQKCSVATYQIIR